jgi:hypothetical protein
VLVEWDAQADLDLPAGYTDLFDDEAHEPLAAVEVEGVDAVCGLGGEGVDASAQSVVVRELAALVDQGGALLLEGGGAGVDFADAVLEVGEVDHAGLVQVEQPAAFGLGLVDAALQPGELGGEELVVGCGGAGRQGAFAGEQRVGCEQGAADLVEHERVELVGADLGLAAAAVGAAGVQRVLVGADVVAVVAAAAGGGLQAGGLDAARRADDEAAQQPRVGGGAARAEVAVGVLDLLGGLEGLGGDDGGHGDLDVFVVGSALPARLAAGTVGRQGLVAVPAGGAGVGGVAQHPGQGRALPHRLAGGAGDAVLVQAPADRSHRQPAGGVVVEDAAHHRRFGLVDDQVRRARVAAGYAPVAVGHLPEDRLARAGPVQPAAAVPLGDLGALVLGDHALHLHQQPRLGVVIERWRVEEAHGHAEAGQLVQDQHLVGVGAREPVGGQAPQRLERPCSAASRRASSPGRSSRAPDWPSSTYSAATSWPASAAAARNASSCEPTVPRSACAWEDTRAYRAIFIVLPPLARWDTDQRSATRRPRRGAPGAHRRAGSTPAGPRRPRPR